MAEFYALNDAAKEGIYLKRLAAEFDPLGRVPKLILLGDNETANNMGELAKWKDKSKHVRIAESYILTESTPWRGPSALAPCRYDEGKVDPPSPPLSLTGGAVVLYRVQELLRLLCPYLVDTGLFTVKI